MNVEKQTISSIRSCPHCSTTSIRIIAPLSFAMFDRSPLSSRQDIAACTHCGFVFVETPSTAEDFHRYYHENLYYTNYTFELLGERSQAEISRHKKTADLLYRFIDDTSKPVVDVGCNNGAQLIALRNAGFTDPRGLDMLKPSVEYIRALGFSAEIGSATELPVLEQKPSAYLFSHVLEHVIDPGEVLRKVWNLLDENGCVYIELPDASAYHLQNLATWYIYLLYEHVNHFDESHLCGLAESNGFAVLETGKKMIPHRGHDQENMVQCLYALFRKTGRKSSKPVTYQGDLESNLSQQIAQTEFDPGHCLANAARAGMPVYIWGISPLVQLMLGRWPLKDCRIAALIDKDSYKQTQTINSMPIMDPEILIAAPKESLVVLPDYRLAVPMLEHLKSIGHCGQTLVLGQGSVVSP